MDTYEAYFSPWIGDTAVRLSYALRHQFGSIGFSDRGPLTVEFANIETMKEALHLVGLPISIADGGYMSIPIIVTTEQMQGLGFDFPLKQ